MGDRTIGCMEKFSPTYRKILLATRVQTSCIGIMKIAFRDEKTRGKCSPPSWLTLCWSFAPWRHLLYVACTRARDYLLVSSGDIPSEFLEDLRI